MNKNVVIVLAHHKIEQLNIFLSELLLSTSCDVYVHINRNYSHLKKEVINSNRIFLTNDNVPINWGDDGILLAILNTISEIIASGKKYHYYIVCSGQDLLVKKGLDEFLQERNEAFVDTKQKPNNANSYAKARLLYYWPKIYKKRYDSKFNPIKIMRGLRHRLAMKGFPFKKRCQRDLFDSIDFYKDYFWFALPHDIVLYIDNIYKNDDRIMSLYKGALIPEEEFFTTMIMRSEFKNRIAFKEGFSTSLHFAGTFENNHPPIITTKDILKIEESDRFFARKFDISKDKNVIKYFYEKTTGVKL